MEWSRHPITGMVGNWALRTRSGVGALQQSRLGRPGEQIHIAAIKVKCGFFFAVTNLISFKANLEFQNCTKRPKAHAMQLLFLNIF
jgi:hypothetical protein